MLWTSKSQNANTVSTAAPYLFIPAKQLYSVWQEAAAMRVATYMRYLQAGEGDATQSAETICGSSPRTESRDHACRVLLTVTTRTSHKTPK